MLLDKMKKQILFSFLFSLSTFIGFSQTLSITHADDSINGSIDASFHNYIIVKNNGISATDVVVERTLNNLATDHESYFCWVNCYDPKTSVSPDHVRMNPGDTTDAFKGYLEHNYTPGISEVEYCFYEKTNTSNKVCHKATFIVTNTTSVKYTTTSLATVFPSVSTDIVNVNLLQASPAVYNLYNHVGQLVQSGNLQNQISLRDLNSGMYFLEILQNQNIQHIRVLKP
jgi:hypothetical protein